MYVLNEPPIGSLVTRREAPGGLLEPLPVCGWPTFPSVLWCCWLGLLTCKTVFRITYTVLVETLNPAQSINQSVPHDKFGIPGHTYPMLLSTLVIKLWSKSRQAWGSVCAADWSVLHCDISNMDTIDWGGRFIKRCIADSTLVQFSESFTLFRQLPLLREEFRLPKLTFHSDLRRRAASRRDLPHTSSYYYYFFF